MPPEALVIGSGFSSLSSACYLAKAGFSVTMLEKNHQPGGRARQLRDQGFTFDIGPTWYWMPDVFENFFADFGHRVSDFYQLSRLDPSYRIYFDQYKYEDIPASKEELYRLFEKYQPGSTSLLKSFLKQAGMTYNLAVKEMAFKPGYSLFEFVTPQTMTNAHLFVQSLRRLVRSKFKHPYLISLLEFPVLFLGAKPGDTPAFYSFMNHADLEMGTWYPDGGMYSVVEGMLKLASDLGVTIHTDIAVGGLEVSDANVRNVITSSGNYAPDVVVSGADYQHTESLLPIEYRNYSEKYWSKRTFAPSALLFFIGLNKKLTTVLHHTLFFDSSFDNHAEAIYDHPSWPEQPLFYINVPSVTDPTVAPIGNECMTILIPIAPGIEDTAEIREKYFLDTIRRFEYLTGEKIIEHIVIKHSYCVNDFTKDYNAYKGNAYGLANTLFQTGYFRPGIRNKKVKNLFYTGQLTVPGGGVPPAIISGKIVAGEIIKKINIDEYAA
ncbi:MAG: phytoene desaturase [Saprospiraceae bacterium]|uniref:Phytoene desaturase n=1 Tax=Candidatus Opimibacter skivensis TaxID=2982028 RepID=A0A9D7T075_9BACT|nr:phytoene desaturase [Candidatus Opimibacter skivensis]